MNCEARQPLPHDQSPHERALHDRITQLGTEVFETLAAASPGPFSLRFWNDRILQLSMRHPAVKVNLFRLIEVLPALSSPAAVADHARAYLSGVAAQIHPALEWMVGLSRHPLAARITAQLVQLGVHQMAGMLIAGTTTHDALLVLKRLRRQGFAFTVDLLGEFCVCEDESIAYQQRYFEALETFERAVPRWKESRALLANHPGEAYAASVSIKLTALYSQVGALNFERSVDILSERLTAVVQAAERARVQVYVDAEDGANNPVIFEVFKRVFSSPTCRSVLHPGIVIQAYARDSEQRVREMLDLANTRGSPIVVRLVKGAYWDYERVVSEQNGWTFPLWSVKESTDAHYERLSRLLLDNRALCLPAFGSHNVRSLAHACCYAQERGLGAHDFELQVLYGMADPIAAAFRDRGFLVRHYVPVGEPIPGMGYLVRRLLENTSNESFLRHTFFEAQQVPILLRAPQMQPVDLLSAEPLSAGADDIEQSSAELDGAGEASTTPLNIDRGVHPNEH